MKCSTIFYQEYQKSYIEIGWIEFQHRKTRFKNMTNAHIVNRLEPT